MNSPLPPITIALVGCGKSKRASAAPAKDLYIGPLFRAARAYAEECDEWRIISARNGFCDPNAVIEPYDVRLKPKDAQQWGQAVANCIVSEFTDCGPYEIVLLAGRDYAAPITNAMRDGDRWRCNCVGVREPLVGLGLGARLRWFAQAWREHGTTLKAGAA